MGANVLNRTDQGGAVTRIGGTLQIDDGAWLKRTVGDATLYCCYHNVLTAEVNAGHDIVAAVSGVKLRPVIAYLIARGGNAGGATRVDIADGDGNVIFGQPVANLTQDAVTTIASSNAVLTKMAQATAANKSIKVIKNGSDLTTATSVDAIVVYAQEA